MRAALYVLAAVFLGVGFINTPADSPDVGRWGNLNGAHFISQPAEGKMQFTRIERPEAWAVVTVQPAEAAIRLSLNGGPWSEEVQPSDGARLPRAPVAGDTLAFCGPQSTLILLEAHSADDSVSGTYGFRPSPMPPCLEDGR